MLGSINSKTISLLQTHLIVAFNCQYYVFSTDNQACEGLLDLGHEDRVACSTLVAGIDKHVLHSFDCAGLYVEAELEAKSLKVGKISKYRVLGQKQQVKVESAQFLTPSCILFVGSDGKLRYFSILNRALSHVAHELAFSLIFNSPADRFAFILHRGQDTISLYHKESAAIQKHYKHSAPITSAISVGDMVVIGDRKGKLTLLYNYLSEGRSNQNQFSSVLEWHTGPVLALCSNGNYIYSAGQESVIVLWHTKDLTRDFLPRVGTAIHYLSIRPQTNQIVCSLADNSIKIIDLSRDKEVTTFKTLIDPQGYAPQEGPRFSPLTTSLNNGVLCLNSLPGKLQFLNLHKNLKNAEFQIIPRNLVNNIDGDKIQPHRISSLAFGQDQSVMAASILTGSNRSYLKFYRKAVQGFQLVNKIQNPHGGPLSYCSAISKGGRVQFISFSLSDNMLRVWSECKEKKKSILDTTEAYWRCSQELKYRNLAPQSVSVLGHAMVVAYGNEAIVVYEALQQGVLRQVESIEAEGVKQVKMIEYDRKKQWRKMKMLVVKKSLHFETWSYSQSKNQPFIISIEQKLQPKQKISSYFVVPGLRSTLIAFQMNSLSELVILDNKSGRFTDSYISDAPIESAFWMAERLILIGSDLTMVALDGGPFVKFEQNEYEQKEEMEEETEVREGEVSILKLSQRWVEREAIRNRNKVEDCTGGLSVYPDCASMWQEMSSRLLL